LLIKKQLFSVFFELVCEKYVILQRFKTINQLTMKKVFSIIAVAAVATSFVACGPSKEELAKREQEKADSIAAVEKARQDSMAAAQAEADKMAAEAEAKRVADSTRVADSLAALSKKGKK